MKIEERKVYRGTNVKNVHCALERKYAECTLYILMKIASNIL